MKNKNQINYRRFHSNERFNYYISSLGQVIRIKSTLNALEVSKALNRIKLGEVSKNLVILTPRDRGGGGYIYIDGVTYSIKILIIKYFTRFENVPRNLVYRTNEKEVLKILEKESKKNGKLN